MGAKAAEARAADRGESMVVGRPIWRGLVAVTVSADCLPINVISIAKLIARAMAEGRPDSKGQVIEFQEYEVLS